MDGEAIEARARALLADCVRRKRPNIAHRIETDSPLSYLPISAGDYFSAIVAALTPKPSAEMRESVARIVYGFDPARFYDRMDGWCSMPWEQASNDAPEYLIRALEVADAILSFLPIVAQREVVERCAKVAEEYPYASKWVGQSIAKRIRALTPTEKRDVE